MWVTEFKKRVTYGETDQMGYLYYGNYAMLYEIGRVEAIRSLGITYKELEEIHKVMMPVISVESRYLGPVKYDELVTIKTTISERPSKLISFYHEIFTEEGQLVHKGTVKLFFVDMKTNKRVSTPEYVMSKLEKYFD
ncbi:MAG: thioesterase family protein [Saprospiraceae bacterium]